MDLVQLRAFFDDPNFTWLWDRLLRRLRQGRPFEGKLSIRNPTPAQRRAVDALLDRDSGNQLQVSLTIKDLAQALKRRGLQSSLEDAVISLANRPEDHQNDQTWLDFLNHYGLKYAAGSPNRELVRRLLQSQDLKVFSRGDTDAAQLLLDRVMTAVEAMPQSPPKSLRDFSQQLFDHPTVLDHERPLGRLFALALAHALRTDEPQDLQDFTYLWAKSGLWWDELEQPVLTFNLIADDDHFTARMLALGHAESEPQFLSVRQLVRDRPVIGPRHIGDRIYLCSNRQTIGDAAYQLGSQSAPLICTDGHFSVGVRLLLDTVLAQGVSIYYHGDFSWAGIDTANRYYAHYGFKPWRYEAKDYQQQEGGGPLRGRPRDALWDSQLGQVVARIGRLRLESAQQSDLLTDLETSHFQR